MSEPVARTCPHGLTASTCLICDTLTPSRRQPASAYDNPGERAAPRRSLRAGPTVAALAVVALAGLLVFSWVAALTWAALRLVELVAVAIVSGWVCWRLGVRHGRRHPR